MYLARLDDEPQELNFGHMELTFLRFSVKMVIKKTSEYFTDMFNMLLEGTREDEDIIQVDEHKLAEHVSENIVYESLKYCRSISETKGHN